MRSNFILSSTAFKPLGGPNNIDDNTILTVFESVTLTGTQECWIMHDYGVGKRGFLYRINFRGDYKVSTENAKFMGAVFEGSNDLNTWT